MNTDSNTQIPFVRSFVRVTVIGFYSSQLLGTHTYLHRFWNLSYSFRHRAQELRTFTHIHRAGLVSLGPIFWRLWSIVSSIFSIAFDKRIFHISVVVLKPFTSMKCKKRRWGSESKCYCRPCSWNFCKHIYTVISLRKSDFSPFIFETKDFMHIRSMSYSKISITK